MEDDKIYFNGFCPESALAGKQVEMKLNSEGFWESPATGLQINVVPPYAVLINWRGKGEFINAPGATTKSYPDLVISRAQSSRGEESLPNEKQLIEDEFLLDWCLPMLYSSKEEYEADQFNPKDPVLNTQEKHLESISYDEYARLIMLYNEMTGKYREENSLSSNSFSEFNELLYNLNLVFSFNWMTWNKGLEKINSSDSEYYDSSLLDLSMYITAIFRGDRFNDGMIEANINNGNLDKIFGALKALNEVRNS